MGRAVIPLRSWRQATLGCALSLPECGLRAEAADLSGGTRAYVRTPGSRFWRDGLLYKDADTATVDESPDHLEDTSGLVAESLDVPPLNIDDLCTPWQALRRQATSLLDAHRLADVYAELQQVTQQEGLSLRTVSALIGAGPVRARTQISRVHLFDYYQDAPDPIAQEGLQVYVRRVTRSYLAVFCRDRSLWWALILAYALLVVAAMLGLIGLGVLDDMLVPAYILLAIALPFFVVYARDLGQWWILIPGAVLAIVEVSFLISEAAIEYLDAFVLILVGVGLLAHVSSRRESLCPLFQLDGRCGMA
jgi:hypothetical protein